jgi:hypothetical protein
MHQSGLGIFRERRLYTVSFQFTQSIGLDFSERYRMRDRYQGNFVFLAQAHFLFIVLQPLNQLTLVAVEVSVELVVLLTVMLESYFVFSAIPIEFHCVSLLVDEPWNVPPTLKRHIEHMNE